MRRTRVFLVAFLIAILLLLSIGPMTASAAGPGCTTYHYVCPGENLFRISLRYGVSMYAIAAANGIWNVNYIRAGQVLCIPWGGGGPPIGPYHRVMWGETLYSISRMYGCSMWAIASANGLWNINYIRAGQILYIPCIP